MDGSGAYRDESPRYVPIRQSAAAAATAAAAAVAMTAEATAAAAEAAAAVDAGTVTQGAIVALAQRLSSLEEDNRVLKMRFGVTAITDLRHTVDAIQDHVNKQITDPPETKPSVELRLDMVLKIITEMMNSKPSKGGDSWNRSVLESKGIQEVPTIENAKTYRQWNKTMKNALDLMRPRSREKLEVVEQLAEEQVIAATNDLRNQGVVVHATRQAITTLICGNPMYTNLDPQAISNELEKLDRGMWSILMAKTTGEAEEKLEG